MSVNRTSFIDYYFLRIIRWSVRQAVEAFWGLLYAGIKDKPLPENPQSIFVLRNNDMGDVLTATPLLQALHLRYPKAQIYVGVGKWSLDLLKENPHVTALEVNAPWYNKVIKRQGFLAKVSYLFGAEMKILKAAKFDIGIDVLGSHWGMLALLKMGCGFRMSVKGYAGGYKAAHRFVEHHLDEHVSHQALRFAGILGQESFPALRPQIYLTKDEVARGENVWNESFPARGIRVVVAPGGGRKNKCWPLENYAAFCKGLLDKKDVQIVVVGGPQDVEMGAVIKDEASVVDKTGKCSLRETFAIVKGADFVVCNSSLVMHVSAAFEKKTFVMLGEFFGQASQHQKQWGYQGISRCLGKEVMSRDTTYTPEEALKTVLDDLQDEASSNHV